MKKAKKIKLGLNRKVISKLDSQSIKGANGRCNTAGPQNSCVPPPATAAPAHTCVYCPTQLSVCWDCLGPGNK